MHTVLSADGTHIAYDRSGSGPALIHVTGALCDRSTGAPLAALLAPYFTVFTYDRRGRGDSGDTAPYQVEREVEDLAAVIAEAGGSASVYGMSSGAALALHAAAQGAAITRLALFEPPYSPDDEERPAQARAYAAKLGELLAAGRRGDAVELFMTMVGLPAELIGQMRNAPMWPAFEALAPTLAYDAAVMGNASTGSALPVELVAKVGVPALVADGGASPAWLRAMASRLADALPEGRHRTLMGQTHDVDPQALAPLLREFLSDPTPARPPREPGRRP
ncbi:alpha/beta fold hydrolase [Nonomuraea sp. NEAU-A123]|uniref:alpha/beta fold hydrolase n=1 Tax=Nonomuraea sp. NEAU-A123 TaxID=2839649 RepID=UPI001BE419E5|nr:alpha/beta hydrolase [Nonomuraea sp. NEAU-A123]MBT2225330.1 alpha/beta hydrolase [Nonomuraea sp. NEAU-A123]